MYIILVVTIGECVLYCCQVQIERGISYSEALETFHVDTQPGEGFYLSKKVRPSTEEFMYHLRATNKYKENILIFSCICSLFITAFMTGEPVHIASKEIMTLHIIKLCLHLSTHYSLITESELASLLHFPFYVSAVTKDHK